MLYTEINGRISLILYYQSLAFLVSVQILSLRYGRRRNFIQAKGLQTGEILPPEETKSALHRDNGDVPFDRESSYLGS